MNGNIRGKMERDRLIDTIKKLDRTIWQFCNQQLFKDLVLISHSGKTTELNARNGFYSEYWHGLIAIMKDYIEAEQAKKESELEELIREFE